MIHRLGHFVDQVTTVIGTDPMPFVALENIGSQTGSLLPEAELAVRSPDATGMTGFRAGDVLFGKLRPYLAKSWRANMNGVCSTELIVMRPRGSVDDRWLGYLAQSDPFVGWAVATSEGVKMPRTSWEKLRMLEVSAPSLGEQLAIADYLDTETALIDATTSARGQLIDLLRERRRVLVMTLTTQGLAGLDAPLALTPWPPSRLPAEWSLVQIRHLARVGRGASPRPIDDPVYFDSGGRYGWVRISDVTASGRYLESTEDRLSEIGASRSVKLEPGSLILSIAASVGNPIVTRMPCCIHDGFVYFAGLKSLEPEYLYYLLLGGGMFGGLGKLGTQLNLNTDTIGEIRVPVPPRSEQVEIVALLDRIVSDIDAAIAAVRGQLELLAERRQALISAAVTGRLEIPGVAA